MADIVERMEKIEDRQKNLDDRIEKIEKHLGIFEITEVSNEGVPTAGRKYEPDGPMH